VLLGGALACGSGAPAKSPAAASPAETPAEAAPAEEAPAESGASAPEAQPSTADSAASGGGAESGAASDDGLDADIAALSASTQEGALPPSTSEAPKAREATAGREIVYRVTPKGLVIEVDGIHLRPEAKPFRDKSGAYGVALVINAESFDGRQYWLNKPSEGPLSIAGKVEAKGGKSSRFADQRQGSGEEVVTSQIPRRFEQRWPGRGQPKLWAGQTLTLEVGLWGVRAESERERPVRRLFVVKMVAGSKSPAVITPPTMDWGS
jgi:hypothetical protein